MKQRCLLLILLVFLLMGCQPTITVSHDADDYRHANYLDVQKDIAALGFQNIILNELENLTPNEQGMNGKVRKVTINQKEDFMKNDAFPYNAPVVIEYHSMKKYALPLALEEIRNLEVQNVIHHLTKAGFVNVTTKDVFDIEADDPMDAFYNEVKIDDASVVYDGMKYPCTAKIEILVHRPKQAHVVNLYIQFANNLLFNKYDVEMHVNDDKFDLPHGQDQQITLYLAPGNYSVVFKDVNRKEVLGHYHFYVNQGLDITLGITCHFSRIDVEEESFYQPPIIEENELLIDFTENDFLSQPYQDVVEELKAKGFTNIKTQPVYDIVWGFTPENSVASIWIQNQRDYQKGKVISKDSEVIVIYHLKRKDKPLEEPSDTI